MLRSVSRSTVRSPQEDVDRDAPSMLCRAGGVLAAVAIFAGCFGQMETAETSCSEERGREADVSLLMSVLTEDHENKALREKLFSTIDAGGARELVRALVTHENAVVRERAVRLADDLIRNWSPGIDQLDSRRSAIRGMVIAMHDDTRAPVRLWVQRAIRHMYDDESLVRECAYAFTSHLFDGDADVRLAALHNAYVFHTGHAGGCLVLPKKVDFEIRSIEDALVRLFLSDGDERVRTMALVGLGWCGRDSHLDELRQYLSSVDRRWELEQMSGPMIEFFTVSPGGAGDFQNSLRIENRTDALDACLEAFRPLFSGTRLQKRNAVFAAIRIAAETHRDPGLELLERTTEVLRDDREHVRFADLRDIARAWQLEFSESTYGGPGPRILDMLSKLAELLKAGTEN